jgi:hypothetical protein
MDEMPFKEGKITYYSDHPGFLWPVFKGHVPGWIGRQ